MTATVTSLLEQVEYERDRLTDIADTLERIGIPTALAVAHRDLSKRLTLLLDRAREPEVLI